jgi:uncharacterized protein (TIGR04551 family)
MSRRLRPNLDTARARGYYPVVLSLGFAVVRISMFSILVVILLVTPAGAQENVPTDTHEMYPGRSFVVIDIDGSFRTRAELWQDVHMGLGIIPNRYGVYPQLSGPDGVREGADFRLRLAPTIHVGEMADIFTVVDLLNVAAGEGGYSDLAQTLHQADQVNLPGSADSLLATAAVRGLWGRVRLLNVVALQAGRIPEHWGMGLVENDGRAIDGDGGDFIDGISLHSVALPLGLQASISWDFPLQGRQVESAFAPWGVGYDPGDWDDIQQWRFKVQIAPPADSDGNYWGAGIYNRLRFQDFTSLGSQSPYEECQLYDWAPGFGCNEMFWRDAFIWTPDVWFKAGLAVAPDLLLKVEMEVAGRYGTVSNTRFVQEKLKRNLQGIGGVARIELEAPTWRAGIEAGGASGDADSLAFGILDAPTLGEPDSLSGGQASELQDTALTSFVLHPGHTVDQILFRRVIGAVTNAWYVKPSTHIEFWQRGPSAAWIEASALYGAAFVAGATPGEETPLGVEGQLGLGARFGDHVETRLDGAVLVPLAGLKNGSSLNDPLPWTTRLLLNYSF